MEVWKDVKGCEGKYQVSNLGRVKSLSRTVLNRGKHMFISKEKILVLSKSRGYNIMNISINGKPKSIRVCRAVAMAFLDNVYNKPEVNHIDGDKNNDNVLNLEWVTKTENMQHASKNNLLRFQYGCLNSSSVKVYCTKNKIIFDTVLEASKYIGLSSSHLSRILRGKYNNTTSLILFKNEM